MAVWFCHDDGTEPPLKITARSLTEYLLKLLTFKGHDLSWDPGVFRNFDPKLVRKFAEEHRELNPSSTIWQELGC